MGLPLHYAKTQNNLLVYDSSIAYLSTQFFWHQNIIYYYLNNVTVLYHEVEIHLELGTSTLITEGETICFSSMSLNSNRPTYSKLKMEKCVKGGGQ